MDLSALRDRIDSVDRQIIALLAERLRVVEEVVLAKLDASKLAPAPEASLPTLARRVYFDLLGMPRRV